MKIEKLKIALVVLIGSIVLGIILSSCSTSSKAKSSITKKMDSSVVSSTSQQGIRLKDSTVVKKSESEYKNSIDVVFADDTASIDIISTEDPIQKANDLAGPQKKKVHKVNIAGKIIESSRPIKSISINNSGKITDIDINQVQTMDSGQLTTTNQVRIIRDDKEVTKEKKFTGANGLIIAGILIIVLAFAIIAIKVGAVKKLKNDLS